MHLVQVADLTWSAGPTSSPTTLPSGVITIVGGPNATAPIVGPHNDAADFYGIILVGLGIALAVVVTRWVFGRRPGPGTR